MMRVPLRGITCLICFPFVLPAVNKDVAKLQNDVQVLQEQVNGFESGFREKTAALEALARQAVERISNLTTRVEVLKSTVDDQLLAPITGLRERIEGLDAALRSADASLAEMRKQLPKPATVSPPAGLSAQTLYKNAIQDATAGRYDLALHEFADYLKYFGTTDLAGDAEFGIAQVYHDQANLPMALQHFDLVLLRYPGSKKAADALYMKGVTLLKMNQRDEAARQFRELLERFPASSVAGAARARLAELK